MFAGLEGVKYRLGASNGTVKNEATFYTRQSDTGEPR